MKSPRKIAVNRLHLSTGEVLRQQVVELSAGGLVTGYHPLTTEEPFTEWVGGDYWVSDSSGETPHK
jgi:hypothetical protein